MSVVQGESRMPWAGLQGDNYSRGQAAVNNWEKTRAVDVISAGWSGCGAIRLAPIRGPSLLRSKMALPHKRSEDREEITVPEAGN